MKAELKGDTLYLHPESEEERNYLWKAGFEGLRLFGTGSYTALSLPSLAGLKQYHLDAEQRVMLGFALGQSLQQLNESFAGSEVAELLRLLFYKDIFPKAGIHLIPYLPPKQEEKKE